jgi:protein involved in polysaccharide export with SLBB domain
MQKRYISYLFFLSAALFLFGCPKAVKTGSVPGREELSKAIESMQGEYRISPQDILDISVYQEVDMAKTVRVSQDGYITYPFAGKLKVADLSVIQLEEKLTEILGKDYFVNPQVSVFVKEYHSRKVFVLGQVKSPGSYELLPEKPMTVVEAITLAGGFTELSSENRTRVIRVENGAEQNITVKVSDVTKKGDKSKDIVLKPGDIIFVPERFF